MKKQYIIPHVITRNIHPAMLLSDSTIEKGGSNSQSGAPKEAQSKISFGEDDNSIEE